MKLKVLVLTALGVAIADQATKALVTAGLGKNQSVEVVPGILNLVHYHNPGAAFGVLTGSGLLGTVFLVLVTLVALVVLAILIRKSSDVLSVFALSLITGGAVGNLIDRLRLGAVVDFLDFHIGPYHWPAFNVADSAISVGVALALYAFYFREPGA